jgi:hypothetical protein
MSDKNARRADCDTEYSEEDLSSTTRPDGSSDPLSWRGLPEIHSLGLSSELPAAASRQLFHSTSALQRSPARSRLNSDDSAELLADSTTPGIYPRSSAQFRRPSMVVYNGLFQEDIPLIVTAEIDNAAEYY